MSSPNAVAHPPLTRFVLIEPSHAGNVGAAARAIKCMGFSQLALVAPRWPNVLARKETIERASGATDVLKNALVVPTLEQALVDMTHVCATVMTARDFGPPTVQPRQHLQTLLEVPSHHWPRGVAFVFGCERFGMSNADVYRCNVALSIATNPTFGSLNLAAAVQLIAYDWRVVLQEYGLDYCDALGQSPDRAPNPTQGSNVREPKHPADAAQIAGLLNHWERVLIALEFLNPLAPKKLMPRLMQLVIRAQPTIQEIDILRGIARSIERVKEGAIERNVQPSQVDSTDMTPK